MKFFGFCFIFWSIAVVANSNHIAIYLQDSIIKKNISVDTLSNNHTQSIIKDSASKTDTDTIPKKIYRKKIILPVNTDSLLQDSLLKDSINQAMLLADSLYKYIDTTSLLSNLTIYHLIPFYINSENITEESDRYAGEKRVQNNTNFDIYIYAYIFLFFLAICINIFQALNGKKYNKNTNLKSDIRRFSKLTNYYHLIIVVMEFLISVGVALFLNLWIQIFFNKNHSIVETKDFITQTTVACFLFFIAKHLITYIVQNLFLHKEGCFIVLYFYKNMLIHLTSLLYIITGIAFFINTPSDKIYFVQISIGLGVLIYVYALFNILNNLRKSISTLIGFLVYMITLEILPYLLFFKFLYTHYFIHL